MNRIEANEFAANWISAWNRKDGTPLHYVDDARFVIKAAIFVGNPVVEERHFRNIGYLPQKDQKIEFTLDHVVWDSDSNELVIFYQANVNGVRTRACKR
jgi:hypothetical protein